MKPHLLSIAFALMPLALSAQNGVWNERIDSSVIRARQVREGLSVIPVTRADLRRTASPLGEADPIKYIQTLPGVSTGMEGSSAYYVRGGNGGNNMTTLDGIPIYGAGHLLGLTTAYPSEIVSGNDFYAGGFPTDAGGFTSSLLQLKSADGDFQKVHGSASVNNFLVGAQGSIPLKTNKSSLLTSVRFSPLGWEYNLLRPRLDAGLHLPDHLRTVVGDAYAKATWKIDESNRVFLSVFGSYDRYGYDQDINASRTLGWSNLIVNLTWARQTSSGWNWETRLSHNGFQAFQGQKQTVKGGKTTRLFIQSALSEEGLQAKASKQIGPALEVQTGADAFLSFFKPGVSKVYQDKELSARAGNPLVSVHGSLHGQFSYSKEAFHASAGIRATLYKSDSYKAILPTAHLSLAYQLSPSLITKATFDHAVQFFHSLEGIPTGWSMEMLIPSTGQNRPETADQAWAGLEFARGPVTVAIGGFYKYMKDLVFYADASTFFNSAWQEWRQNLESGTGHAYGIEFFSHVETGRFSGQLAYTLSKTDRLFPNQNFGKPIPFKFDRRHVLNLTGEYILGKRARASHGLSAGLSLASGHWETVKSGSYPIWSLGPEDRQETIMADYTSHPNNFQLPLYFRTDLGYHLTLHGRNCAHDLSIGIYNLTNRHNAYSLSWDSKDGKWKKLSIFPILPNFTYRISFGRN